MNSFMTTRSERWNSIADDGVDVLVVGGGIVGTGIARDAARRGLSVVLCEMDDLAYGTSSRSSKLVHGGLRYLEQYEFSMVFESVSERRTLMDLAPHLVNPLGFLFPVYQDARKPLFLINAGMWLYDGLALFRAPRRHENLKADKVREVEPLLDQRNLKGAPLYYDCSTDDARLTLETALDAQLAGATILTRAKVTRLLKDERGLVVGARIEDPSGELASREIRAGVVVNATGPWTDDTRSMSHVPGEQFRAVLRRTKGIHVVVPAEKLPLNHAVVCFHPEDKRVLFALPWGDRTYIGTTDTDYEGDLRDVAATSEDVHYLLRAAARYFPKNVLSADDVIATWAGLRPLVAPQDSSVGESAVSREHEILVGRDGLITIAGGKLTTYRKMAAEVVDQALNWMRLGGKLQKTVRPAKTETIPLPGGDGWPEDDNHDAVAAQVREASGGLLSQETARHLADTYGMRAIPLAESVRETPAKAKPLVDGRPEIEGQVYWAAEQELALTVSDVLIRRTQLFYRDLDQGLGCAERVAEILSDSLSKDGRWRRASVEEYREEVDRSRRWRHE